MWRINCAPPPLPHHHLGPSQVLQRAGCVPPGVRHQVVGELTAEGRVPGVPARPACCSCCRPCLGVHACMVQPEAVCHVGNQHKVRKVTCCCQSSPVVTLGCEMLALRAPPSPHSPLPPCRFLTARTTTCEVCGAHARNLPSVVQHHISWASVLLPARCPHGSVQEYLVGWAGWGGGVGWVG